MRAVDEVSNQKPALEQRFEENDSNNRFLAKETKVKYLCRVALWVALSHGLLVADAACLDAPAPNVDWSGCDKHGANLEKANLEGADLQGADLRGANLRGVNLQHARLAGADFGSMRSNGEFLRGADLRDANLQWANIRDANLDQADILGANLQGTDLYRTTWTDGKKVCGIGSIGVCK